MGLPGPAVGSVLAAAVEELDGWRIGSCGDLLLVNAATRQRVRKGSAMPLFDPVKASRIICVEEHFGTAAFYEGPGAVFGAHGGRAPLEEIFDIGAARIADMDAAGVDVQLLSLNAPGVEPLEPQAAIVLARDTNDHLAAAVAANPGRFAGLAALPMSDPLAAAAELKRSVSDLGLKGAVINGHSRGRYLDDEAFHPFLAQAQDLRAPLYLHPTLPPEPVMQSYYSGSFPTNVGIRLATAGWGWHIETGTHVLRLVLSGTFDRFPDLQIVIGHQGEVLPIMLPLLERTFPSGSTDLKRPIRGYMQENLSYSFGGWNWASMYHALRRAVDIERIMFASDYPYVAMSDSVNFLNQLEISSADRELIAHANAERIFGL